MTRSVRSGRVTVLGPGDGGAQRVLEATGGHAADAVVELGSVTKTITATAAAVLTAQGLLDPSAPLEEHLPVPPDTGVTVDLLVRHRSGLPRLGPGVRPWSRDPYRGFDQARLARVLAELPRVLARPPDSHEAYSNLGYAVLGEVVGRVGGGGWYACVRRLVLDPAGLTDIVLPPDPAQAVVGAGRSGRARTAWTTGAMAPAGGLWGTALAAGTWVAQSVVHERYGPPCAAWQRMGPAVWSNGATRDASLLVAALPGSGQHVAVHAIGQEPAQTDEHGLRLLARSREHPAPVTGPAAPGQEGG